jgi:hypothetical protein
VNIICGVKVSVLASRREGVDRGIEPKFYNIGDCGLMASEQIFRNNSENELRFDEMIIISALH